MSGRFIDDDSGIFQSDDGGLWYHNVSADVLDVEHVAIVLSVPIAPRMEFAAAGPGVSFGAQGIPRMEMTAAGPGVGFSAAGRPRIEFG